MRRLYRRRTWCTLCSLALRHLSNCLPMFRVSFAANLVAISGQLPQHNFACEASNQLAFPVLCDRGARCQLRILRLAACTLPRSPTADCFA